MVWHFIRSLDKRKLERLQEKGLRAVFKDKSRNMAFIGDLHLFRYSQNSKLFTDRLINIYELQPLMFGQITYLHMLSKWRKFAIFTPLQCNAHFTFYGVIKRTDGKHLKYSVYGHEKCNIS